MSAGQSDLRPIAEQAANLVAEGNIVGLGTGRAAATFIRVLGERVRGGLKIRGVPTSQASERLARELGIPLVSLDEIEAIDIAVDGADEVDPQLNAIKGYGGAMVRERVVASLAKQFVIVIGPEKLVPALGTRGKLPVEVVPFALASCRRQLERLGCPAELRRAEGEIFRSDNGNPILDAKVGPLADAAEFDQAVRRIPGVVDTGLFLGMADVVLVQHADRIETLNRKQQS